MPRIPTHAKPTIPALRVAQWLPEWEEVTFDKKALQSRPDPYFYLLSLRASHLKALTGVYRRSARPGKPRAKDPNVQRGHEEIRSRTIREFVKYGFPWCDMGKANREAPDASLLRKPGWLPTAIVINILEPGAERNGVEIGKADLVTVVEEGDLAKIELPRGFTGSDWEPQTVFPLEVVDGQHRLWAFEDFDPGDSFELPVVAFRGLDRGWQAYLFWSVNITPKRINRSLAYDLYPLLRRLEWLTKFTGHGIYRETRCQELTEALWSHPKSPWHERINMLGETAKQLGKDIPMVTQAAWIRSLMASFVKEWAEGGSRIGGLFGAGRSRDDLVLPWNRPMQVAFLIFAGTAVREAVAKSKAKWAVHLRKVDEDNPSTDDQDPAFYGAFSLLATDQGMRGLLQVTNDLCYLAAEHLNLSQWHAEMVYSQRKAREETAATDEGAVDVAVASLHETPVGTFLTKLAIALATYDWRTSSTPGLSDEERLRQAVFRGSSGYKEMRRQLLLNVSEGSGDVAKTAQEVIKVLGYE